MCLYVDNPQLSPTHRYLPEDTLQEISKLYLSLGFKLHPRIMSDRKVISKYYPPDFEPNKLTRQRKPQSTASKLESVRLSSPFSMRCNRCGEYIYKGRKFNARKQITDEHYLNILIVRLFICCTACSSEISFDTDFKNGDYKDIRGATRNVEPWRKASITQETEEQRLDQLGREGEQDELVGLETKATNAEIEMAVADGLDEIMTQNARREIRIRNNTARNAQEALDDENINEEATRKAFGNDVGEVVRRLPDEETGVGENVKDSTFSNPEFQRLKRKKKDHGVALGIKRNKTT